MGLSSLPSKTTDGKFEYLPPNLFPLEDAEPPEGKNGWLLFFDELDSADRGTQKAAYKVILRSATVLPGAERLWVV